METIFRYVARWLAAFLERWADPELQAKLDAYNARVAEADKRAKIAEQLEAQSNALYLTSAQHRREWDALLVESRRLEQEAERQFDESQARVIQLKADAAKAKQDIDRLSDAAAVRGNV